MIETISERGYEIKFMSVTGMKLDSNICFVENDMWWNKNDLYAYPYLKHENKDFVAKIMPHLRGSYVAVQAGGHCGWMVRELSKQFQYIYTFEPHNIAFACLCMNLPNENIFKFQACVGNQHNLVDMCKHPKAGSDFINSTNGLTPTLMIDDLNLKSCNFIQLDIEGYEYHALLGATKTIEAYKPVLCLERCWAHRYGISDEVFDTLLKDWGYVQVDGMAQHDRIYKYKGA